MKYFLERVEFINGRAVMELFNRFRNTVFLKEDSDLEKQLHNLKNIRNKVSNTYEIDKDIKLLEYGIKGENDIAFE